MLKLRKTISALFLAMLTAASAQAFHYTGTMSLGDSPATLNVEGQSGGWPAGFLINFQVLHDAEGGPGGLFSYYYEYEIAVAKFAPRHLIVELGTRLTTADIRDVKLYQNEVLDAGWTNWSVDTWIPEQINPALAGLPDSVYGALFEGIGTGQGSDETVKITFWSTAEPVWADFYSRCDGNGNRAWNLGFTTADTDPAAAPSSGVYANHLLTPGYRIPEPSSLLLLALGLLGLLSRGRRRHVVS